MLYGGNPAPPLTIVAAYSPEAFRHLLTTGESVSGRELGTMREVALGWFSHFTPEEIDAIYAYLGSPDFRALS